MDVLALKQSAGGQPFPNNPIEQDHVPFSNLLNKSYQAHAHIQDLRLNKKNNNRKKT